MLVLGQEVVGGDVVDERLVHQPFDGSALGPRVTEFVPQRTHFRVFLVQLVLERRKAPDQ